MMYDVSDGIGCDVTDNDDDGNGMFFMMTVMIMMVMIYFWYISNIFLMHTPLCSQALKCKRKKRGCNLNFIKVSEPVQVCLFENNHTLNYSKLGTVYLQTEVNRLEIKVKFWLY